MAGSSMRGGRPRKFKSEINVVPYIDVMLVLLVIFMVTAPMMHTGIDVELPETRNVKDVNAEERVILSISREGDIFYGAEAVNFADVPARLKQDARDPKEAIFLRADKDVKWNSIVSVIDAVRGAGFSEIKLVTKPFALENKR